jgi:hypothetical protein
MNISEIEIPVDSEVERVTWWRAEELVRAGYDPDAAFELAAQRDVDLHAALDLVARGCPPPLAARILL